MQPAEISRVLLLLFGLVIGIVLVGAVFLGIGSHDLTMANDSGIVNATEIQFNVTPVQLPDQKPVLKNENHSGSHINKTFGYGYGG